MNSIAAIFFALLALSQALHHVELERHQHVKKHLPYAEKSILKGSGLAYVDLEGSIETTGEYYCTIHLGSNNQK